MFTGLIKEVGAVTKCTPFSGGRILCISSPVLSSQMQVGDSVAVNGVCQTVVEIEKPGFKVQAVPATLKKTTLGELGPKDAVNLELALTPQDRLGGHFLQGHVNGVGVITQIQRRGDNHWPILKFPPELKKYIVQEGSVAIDGISLTVAEYRRGADSLAVAIVPHTWEHTNLKHKKAGDKANIEVDILAKYVENMLLYSSPTLQNKGFFGHV